VNPSGKTETGQKQVWSGEDEQAAQIPSIGS